MGSGAGVTLAERIQRVRLTAQEGLKTAADAIRGSLRQEAVAGFLDTSEGKRLQSEATRQTIQTYVAPLVVGVVLLLIASAFFRKEA